MWWVKKRVQVWLENEDGPTAVEYAVLLALIISACMYTLSLLGSNVSDTLIKVSASMDPSAVPSTVPSGTSKPSGAAAPSSASPAQ